MAVVLLAAGCTRDLNGVPTGIACQAPGVRVAWAVAVSGSGRVLWRSELAAPGAPGAASPIAIGRVAVVAEGRQVLGLRLADGQLSALADAGALSVHVAGAFPLSRAADAHRLSMRGGTHGKIVVFSRRRGFCPL